MQTDFFMELFSGNELDRRIMERAGCLSYLPSSWESEKTDVYQRQLYYKFDKRISSYGGEVTSTQQKSHLPEKNGWLLEEVMTLHGVPLGDYFTVWILSLLVYLRFSLIFVCMYRVFLLLTLFFCVFSAPFEISGRGCTLEIIDMQCQRTVWGVVVEIY